MKKNNFYFPFCSLIFFVFSFFKANAQSEIGIRLGANRSIVNTGIVINNSDEYYKITDSTSNRGLIGISYVYTISPKFKLNFSLDWTQTHIYALFSSDWSGFTPNLNNIKLNYVQVPMLLQYHPFDKKFNFYLQGGIVLNRLFMMQNDVSELATPSETTRIRTFGKRVNDTHINMYSDFGLGLGYNFGKNSISFDAQYLSKLFDKNVRILLRQTISQMYQFSIIYTYKI